MYKLHSTVCTMATLQSELELCLQGCISSIWTKSPKTVTHHKGTQGSQSAATPCTEMVEACQMSHLKTLPLVTGVLPYVRVRLCHPGAMLMGTQYCTKPAVGVVALVEL